MPFDGDMTLETQQQRIHTLQAFSIGCRKDVLKNLIDFSRDVLSQSAIQIGL
jgi:hypothetical protein